MQIHQDLIDQTVDLKHRPKDERICDKGRYARQKDRHTEEAFELQVVRLQNIRKEKSQDQHDRNLDDQEQEIVPERLDKCRILKHLDVVAKADKRRVQTLVGIQGENDGIEERIQHECCETDQDRKRELQPHSSTGPQFAV